MAVLLHRLTFRAPDLEPVRAGTKRCTIRFSVAAARIRNGDALELRFGAYHKPVVLDATAARIAHIDLTDALTELRAGVAALEEFGEDAGVAAAEDALVATLAPAELRQAWLEAGVSADLIDALADSCNDYDSILFEADDRGATRCTCVWWTLA